MRYPLIIHYDTIAYGVTVPDIPGCISAADTLDEAMENITAQRYSETEQKTTATSTQRIRYRRL